MSDKKLKFDVTLFTRDLLVNVTCDEKNFQCEIQFNSEDEWYSFMMADVMYDIHLLFEPAIDEQDSDGWEVSIYRCNRKFISHSAWKNLNWETDISESATQIVNLCIHDDGNEDDGGEADCIAREYEWHCVHCDGLNIIYEWREKAFCCECGESNKLAEPVHALE